MDVWRVIEARLPVALDKAAKWIRENISAEIFDIVVKEDDELEEWTVNIYYQRH